MAVGKEASKEKADEAQDTPYQPGERVYTDIEARDSAPTALHLSAQYLR